MTNDKADFTQGRILKKLVAFMMPVLGALRNLYCGNFRLPALLRLLSCPTIPAYGCCCRLQG